ncbi:MAG: DUF4440 domain-containing protein [Flavobacteriales bacterium]|nr:DUF4440 domain-containing protein [Flavobacteriales bacterium]
MKYALLTLAFLAGLVSNGQNYSGPKEDIDQILTNIKEFSAHYEAKEYRQLANMYTEDGKIFPSGTDIIEGREAIHKRWVLPEGVTILDHTVTPLEINVLGDQAYDYGYYAGSTQKADGSISNWKGKYVIIWQKVEGNWEIYLDIWNRIDLAD